MRDGNIEIDDSVEGGVADSHIVGNGTPSINLTGSQDEINNTLASDMGVTYTPNQNYNGASQLIVSTDDKGHNGAGATARADITAQIRTDVIDITVDPINDPPVLSIPFGGSTQSITEGTVISTFLEATDVDGDTLTFSADDMPPAASLDADTGEFTWTPGYEDAGTFEIDFSVSDGTDSASYTVTMEVSFIDDDGDGLPDTWEPSVDLDPTTMDSDGDTISDGEEVGDYHDPLDSDGDDTIDALDEDSDDDGTSDEDEAGDDDLETEPLDIDDDGIPDYIDTDSDNDGVLDTEDNCRIVENGDQEDLDDDDIGDACEDDTDGDGITNGLEERLEMNPVNPDSDGDGILDKDELTDFDDPEDSDGDGTIDALDEDSDDDGVLDQEEAGDDDPQTPPDDTDSDGTPDFIDVDSDDDNIEDDVDNCRIIENEDQLDTDKNDTGDLCDDDMDGDGVINDIDSCPLIANSQQEDIDYDDIGDACDPEIGPSPESKLTGGANCDCRIYPTGSPGVGFWGVFMLVALGALVRLLRRRR